MPIENMEPACPRKRQVPNSVPFSLCGPDANRDFVLHAFEPVVHQIRRNVSKENCAGGFSLATSLRLACANLSSVSCGLGFCLLFNLAGALDADRRDRPLEYLKQGGCTTPTDTYGSNALHVRTAVMKAEADIPTTRKPTDIATASNAASITSSTSDGSPRDMTGEGVTSGDLLTFPKSPFGTDGCRLVLRHIKPSRHSCSGMFQHVAMKKPFTLVVGDKCDFNCLLGTNERRIAPWLAIVNLRSTA